MRRAWPWLALAMLVAACLGKRVPPHAGIDPLWHQYEKLKDARAMAVAGDPNRIWVGAVAGGAPTRSEAERLVLERCRTRRKLRRLQAPCRLYASGDDIVWETR